jgi:Carboxypeptidase regulatory-like domain/TonB-dependent Receptor Plug Domain/TonB dependent receptor
MKNLKIKTVLLTTILLLTFASIAFGQQDSGQINGTVEDQNGAAIAGATVKVKNVGTNAERSGTTNNSGYYVVTNLLPGQYEVTVNQTGFAAKTVKSTVSVGGASTVNVSLGVTAGNAVVDIVSTGIAEINTTDQQQSTVVTDRQIQNLPILNNNPYSLVALAPNVSTNDPSGRGAGVAINGQRAASTNILLDGTENSNTFTATIAQNVPQDAVSEFRVLTNTFGAEFGRATGGVVNVSTKSGTNSFRGSAFAQNRNSALASSGFNNNANGLPKGKFNRNQDGFTIGGPIKKDKLFFFNSLQSTIIRSSATVLAWVPTSSFISAAAPATQAFFTAYGALSATPTGRTGLITTANPLSTIRQVSYNASINAGGGTPENGFQNVAKIDWVLSDKTTLNVSWKLDRDDFAAGTAANSPYSNYDASTKSFSNNFQGSIVHNFTSNLILDAKLSYRRTNDTVALNTPANTPTLYLLGVTARAADGNCIAFPGYNPCAPGSGLPTFGTEQLWDLKPNATWIKGNHTLRFGGQYVFLNDQRRFGAYEGANYNLSSGTSLATGVANFLSGNAQLLQVAIDPQGQTPGGTINLPVKSPNFNRTNQYNEFAFYFTDGWRVRSGFNLNLGVRYEYFGPQKSKEDLDSNFYFGAGSTIQEQIRNGGVKKASTAGGLWKKDLNNWSPRLGFAWDITGDGKTSIRGGYGIGYERNFGNVTFNVIQNPPFYAVLAAPSPLTVTNFGSLGASSGTAILPRSSLRHVREDIVNAYAHQWGLTFEREIAQSTTIRAEYSASAGRDQYTLENINRAGTGPRFLSSNTSTTCPATIAPNNRLNCQFSNINTRANNGYNNNRSLSISLESNNLLKTGLITTFRYTTAVNKDNLSSTFSESGNNFNLGLLDPFNPSLDYGYSDYDTRHRFVSSVIYPFKTKFENRAANTILGGWVLSSIWSIESGAPFTVFDCTNASATVCIRAEQNAISAFKFNGDTKNTSGVNTFDYINHSTSPASIFTDVSGGTEVGPFPTTMSRRNSFRSPGQWYVDMGLSKDFSFGERYKLQFRIDAFNVFNHANLFVDGNADISNASGFVRAFKAGSRTAQGGVRFSF